MYDLAWERFKVNSASTHICSRKLLTFSLSNTQTLPSGMMSYKAVRGLRIMRLRTSCGGSAARANLEELAAVVRAQLCVGTPIDSCRPSGPS